MKTLYSQYYCEMSDVAYCILFCKNGKICHVIFARSYSNQTEKIWYILNFIYGKPFKGEVSLLEVQVIIVNQEY